MLSCLIHFSPAFSISVISDKRRVLAEDFVADRGLSVLLRRYDGMFSNLERTASSFHFLRCLSVFEFEQAVLFNLYLF